MKRLKVVQIGIGHDHAIWAWGSLKKQTDIFDVIGWCPIDDEGERPAIKYYPAEERLTLKEVLIRDDIDAVFIETDDWNLTVMHKYSWNEALLFIWINQSVSQKILKTSAHS